MVRSTILIFFTHTILTHFSLARCCGYFYFKRASGVNGPRRPSTVEAGLFSRTSEDVFLETFRTNDQADGIIVPSEANLLEC